jgi:hypothetical protein
VGILSEMHSVVSWRDSLPNDALLEVHAWLDRGDPDAGVKAVAVRHMIGGFIGRYELVWVKMGRSHDDIPDPKRHTAWGDPTGVVVCHHTNAIALRRNNSGHVVGEISSQLIVNQSRC